MLLRRKPPPVRALLFDIGGVVVDTDSEGVLQASSLLFGCTREALSAHLAPLVASLERGEIDSLTLWEDLGELLEASGEGRAQDPEKVASLWTQMIEGSLKIDQEMISLCRRLQDKIPVGALSNTIAEHAAYLEAYGVYDLFNPCILSHEVGMRKPESGIYKLALELLGIRPENCLFVDDLEANLQAAKALKMQTHLFTDRENFLQALARRGL